MKNVDKLLADHKKLIEYEVRNHAKFIPAAVAQVTAYKLAREAAESFDPSTGVKFSTYLTNQLKKLSRLSTEHGATVRIPENKQFKIQHLNQAEKTLKAELNRPPSVMELSEKTGFPLALVNNLLNSRKHDTAFSSVLSPPVFFENGNEDWVHMVYHDLTDIDRLIFEHKTGFGGRAELNNEEIAKLVKLSPSTVANRAKVITDKLVEGWQN